MQSILRLGATLALLGFGVQASATPPADTQAPTPQTIYVQPGMHKLLRESSPVGRLAVGDPKIADVNMVNSRELLLTGKTLGSTNLLVWSRSEARKSTGLPVEYRLVVGQAGNDAADLKGAQINPGQSLGGELSGLVAHRSAELAASGSGKNSAPADYSKVNINTQVLTDIKIVEVQRNVINKFGLNILKPKGTTAVLGAPGTFAGLQRSSGTTTFLSSSGFVPLQNAFGILVGANGDGIFGVLSVLESNGLARVLAEPSLTATSGQTATFLAGGEFPVPIAQSGSGSSGSQAITIQYKEFGVRLSLTPTVLSPDDISLKVAPEVSDLDFANAVTVSGTTVPALTVRRTDTTIQLGDGQSFIISGLVSNNLTNNVDKVPWLGDLPVIGAFFRTTDYERKQRELIMVVTPHLVRPLAAGAQLPALPGAKTDQYNPSFADTMFFDTGHAVDADTGYSH